MTRPRAAGHGLDRTEDAKVGWAVGLLPHLAVASGTTTMMPQRAAVAEGWTTVKTRVAHP